MSMIFHEILNSREVEDSVVYNSSLDASVSLGDHPDFTSDNLKNAFSVIQ